MTRGLWDRETVAAVWLAALLPLAVAWLMAGGWPALARLAAAALAVAAWNLVFMLARAQPPSLAGLVCALAFAMLAPDAGPLALLAGLSFGIVFGELAFGGWGRGVLSAAAVALAFTGFGFPAAPWPVLPAQIGWAALPAAAMGVLFGVLSVPLVAAAALAFGLAYRLDPAILAALPAFGAALVLLAADPVASAATPGGRWANGALYGGLFALFLAVWTDAAPVQAAVSAALLASLAAPLVDEMAIGAWLMARRRRHG